MHSTRAARAHRPHGPVRLELATLVLLAVSGCRGSGASGAETAAAAPVRLGAENVVQVKRDTLESGPLISGRLQPRLQATVLAETGGTVVEARVDAGDQVKAGDPLARIDDQAAGEQLSAARLALRSAETAREVARLEAERSRKLAEAGGIAERDRQQAEAGLAAASARLAEAKAAVARADQQLRRTRVRSPIDGIVSLRRAGIGDVVGPGAPLYTIVDPRSLRLEALVPAEAVGKIAPGARVDFTVTGFGERTFEGVLEQVSPVVDAATGQVRVYAAIPNADRKLLGGLFAEGRVATDSKVALVAPLEAIDLSTSPPSVVRVRDGAAERVSVELGMRDDVAHEVELRSGVAAGDLLVLGAARGSVADGASVQLERRTTSVH